MENTIRTDVMDAISNIDAVVAESDLSVLSSMIDSFDKASVILENYNGDDVDMFNIFQEADEGKENPFKEDTWWKTILYFIPNLVGLIISKIKKLFGKEEQTKTQQVINSIKNAPQEAKNFVSSIMESAAKFIADKTGMEEDTAEKVVTIAGYSVPIGLGGALINKATEAASHGANLVQRFFKSLGKAPSNPGDAKYVFHKYTKGAKKDTWSSSIDLEVLLKNVKEYSDVVGMYQQVYDLISDGKEDMDLARQMAKTNDRFLEITKTNYFIAKPKEYKDEDIEKFLTELNNTMNGMAEKCVEIQKKLNSFKHTKFNRKDESGEYAVPQEIQKLLKNDAKTASTNMNNITKYIMSLTNLKTDLDTAFQKAQAVVNEGESILQKIKNGVTNAIDKAKSKFKKDGGDTEEAGSEDDESAEQPASDEESAKNAEEESAESTEEEKKPDTEPEATYSTEYDTSWYNR